MKKHNRFLQLIAKEKVSVKDGMKQAPASPCWRVASGTWNICSAGGARAHIPSETGEVLAISRIKKDFLIFPCWNWEHYSVAMDAKIVEIKARNRRHLVLNPNSWVLCPVQEDWGFSTLGTIVFFSKYPSLPQVKHAKQGSECGTAPAMCADHTLLECKVQKFASSKILWPAHSGLIFVWSVWRRQIMTLA